MSHPLYWIALQQALGVPSPHLKVLMDYFGSPEDVFSAAPRELKLIKGLKEKTVDAILAKPYAAARAIWDDCGANGIWMLTPDDPRYPESLRMLPDMPCVLYGRGTLPDLRRQPAVAVVGTRKPTVYGQIATRRVASVLAAAGAVVVSGGALGIDSAAHRAAMEAGGVTVAVLGGGFLSGYLQANRELREQIAGSGALLCEYPPRTPATHFSFPVRNRLIAGLTLGTVVIEAGVKSGSLITAACALEQGKDVFALPGSVMSPNYEGSNKMIDEGATPIFSGLDVLASLDEQWSGGLDLGRASRWQERWNREELTVQRADPPAKEEPSPAEAPSQTPPSPAANAKNLPLARGKDLPETARLVYNTVLDAGSARLDAIIAETGLASNAVLRALTDLELDGLITRTPAGDYCAANAIEE